MPFDAEGGRIIQSIVRGTWIATPTIVYAMTKGE